MLIGFPVFAADQVRAPGTKVGLPLVGKKGAGCEGLASGDEVLVVVLLVVDVAAAARAASCFCCWYRTCCCLS